MLTIRAEIKRNEQKADKTFNVKLRFTLDRSVKRISILKEIKKKYRLKIKNFSCHSLRKTFGRQVYNMNSDNSELALVKLMELFNHSSVSITKRYLGLRQEEILETYDCLSF